MSASAHIPLSNGYVKQQEASFDLAIVGGGITGLALALAVHQHAPHIPFTIYEAAARFGEIGAGVGISPNASRALKLIHKDVQEAFERKRTPNGDPNKKNVWFDIFCGVDGPERSGVKAGEHVMTVDMGQPRGGVHRAHWVDELVRLLPVGRGKFGKRLIGLEETTAGVRLDFADGTSAIHGAFIACDGIKSKARQILLGTDHPAARAVFSGKYCYRGLIPMDAIAAQIGDLQARNATSYWGYHRHLIAFPIEQGKTLNIVAFASKDTWDCEEWVVPASKEDMFRDFAGWGRNVQKILELVEKPDVWALFDHPPADTYCKGRVCLAGDAAHASTPHQGAGASLGIEDAYVMGMILKEVKRPGDFASAFKAFDQVRRPRTQHLVTTSREAGQLYEFELEGVGDDLIKACENLRKRMAWIWDHHVEDDVVAALKILQEGRSA